MSWWRGISKIISNVRVVYNEEFLRRANDKKQTAALQQESNKLEHKLMLIQNQIIENRFIGQTRKVERIYLDKSSQVSHVISKNPLRIYMDDVVQESKCNALITGLNKCIEEIGINNDITGEGAINPLEATSEEFLGLEAYTVASNLKNNVQNIVQKCTGIEKLEVAGSLLSRLRKPTKLVDANNVNEILASYATPHIDKANRISYDISSILYLNDSVELLNKERNGDGHHKGVSSKFERSFTGGRFAFNDDFGQDTVIIPRTGRLLIFSSGPENMHQVQHVLSGSRYTFAVWFKISR